MAQLPRVGDLFGRYRIDDQIGFGGMGVVYGATDLDLGRRVAVKVLSTELGGSAEFLQRFQREAALLARLASPHVIGVYDYGEHDGSPYIVTQFVGGGDLGDLLRARGPMPPALALDVCAQIADALADTHRLGVIHRDVKPSNVLLRDPDAATLTAYLCDFGIARTSADGLTTVGTVSGTWAYLAPEVAMGGPATPASDIYALGCLLWAALTGSPPYAGSDVEMALAHQRAPVPHLAAMLGQHPYLARLDGVLGRCLAKAPAERYADADSLRSDLLALAADPAAPPAPLPVPRASGRSGPSGPIGSAPALPGRAAVRRRTTAIAAAATAVVLLGAGAALGVTRPWESGSTSAGGPTDPSGSGSPTPSSPAPAKGPILGDLDGDGRGDVVITRDSWSGAADEAKDMKVTLHSTGTGFAPASPESLARSGAYKWFVGDVDGDERADVSDVRVTGPKKSPRIQVTSSLPSERTFSATLPAGDGRTADQDVLGFADVDGDGTADLLSYHVPVDKEWRHHGTLTIYAQTGSGTGAGARHRLAAVKLADGGWQPDQVRAGDLNGDGRADLVVEESPTEYESAGIRIRTTVVVSGAGGYGKPQTTIRIAQDYDVGGMLVGDFDGDGRDEIAYLTNGDSDDVVRVARYTTRLTKPDPWGVVPALGYGDVGLSDVNGDGRADLVSAGWKITSKDRNPANALVEVALAGPHEQFGDATKWAVIPRKFSNGAALDVIAETEFS